jgi:hypothetical protein
MSKSISGNFCGNFRVFLSIFHAFKTISRFSRIVFAFKIISENKNPIPSVRAEPEGPTRSTPLRPIRGPLEPIRAQALAGHGQHGLSAAAAFLGVHVTPMGPARPYKATAKPPHVPCSQAATSIVPRHPCVHRRLRRAPPAVTSIRRRGVPPEQGDATLSSAGSSRTPSTVSHLSSNAGVSSPPKDRAEPPELRRRLILAAPPRPCCW